MYVPKVKSLLKLFLVCLEAVTQSFIIKIPNSFITHDGTDVAGVYQL